MKKPECFKDLLELQKILDSNIHNVRERTDKDIILSLIAEIIEWNEESKYSHKTWKTKAIDKQKEFEEMIDILFFILQYINWEEINRPKKFEGIIKSYINAFDNFKLYFRPSGRWYDYGVINLINQATNQNIYDVLFKLTHLFVYNGYTMEDVKNGYYAKWQKNMKRIGTEWN